MRIPDLLVPRTTSVLLGAYSSLGVFVPLLMAGIYNECCEEVLGGRVGAASIAQAAVNGILGGTLIFFSVFATTNQAVIRKTKEKQKRGSPEIVTGIVNASEIFSANAILFYFTPYAFNSVLLSLAFIISAVVGVSTFITLHDWKLADLHDAKLKLADLKFVHADALQRVNLIASASIVFLAGVVVASLNAPRDLPPGSPKSDAWTIVLILFVVEAVFVGIGIWWGWLAPAINTLEEVRLELRKLDAGLQKRDRADHGS